MTILDANAKLDAAPVIRALLTAGKKVDLEGLFKLFCETAGSAGLPLDRVSLQLRTLHPQILAHSLVWTSADRQVTRIHRSLASMTDPDFQNSPLPSIFRGGPACHEDLRLPAEALRFPLSRELKEQGFTGYCALPLPFDSTHPQVLTAATRAPDGFAPAGLEVLEACVPALTLALEVRLLQEMAHNLLSTYVGERAGKRVWEGSIHRGEGEEIFAVVYTCDLRGFTSLAAGMDLKRTTSLLNAFFDAMGEPILERGGEILKLIGDAILAVFPCSRAPVARCGQARAALEAAQQGLRNLAAVDTSALGDKTPLVAGAALTVGKVLYGNIGVSSRLDFTVIGPAVNVAARLQSLSPSLGEPLLMSSEIASRLDLPVRSLGHFALKGVPEKAEVFAPA